MGKFLCYPKRLHPYGNDVVVPHSAAFGADIMISLMDTWVTNPEEYPKPMKWCVPAGTLVKMADGSEKPIEMIGYGDLVISEHPNSPGVITSRVTQSWQIPARQSGEIIEIVTESGKRLEVTSENTVASIDENDYPTWVDAGYLSVGDMVYCYRDIPYDQRRKDNEQENPQDKEYCNGSEKQMGGILDPRRGSLRGWDSRWGGDNIHSSSNEAQSQFPSLHTYPQSLYIQYQPDSYEMAGATIGNEYRREDKTRESQNRMDNSDQRLSLLQFSEDNRAVPDCEERIGPSSNGIYRKSGNYQRDSLQPAVFGTRDRDMAKDSRYELQRVISISRKGRPYEYVYDITTEAGNFFAGGILIHNCPWYPVDHDPMPAIVRGKIGLAYKRISFSKFGVQATHDAGLDCYYIPHGIETNIMRPLDKAEARQKLGIPNDKFVVGTVAMNKGNPSRKCFTEMLDAFQKFNQKHPDSVYVLQTEKGEGVEGMVNLPEVVRNFGLTEGKEVIFCNQYQQMLGFPPEYMADMYNAMDVHLITTRGEGFGIPILEAQACGTPVITGGWTACKELFFAGQLLDQAKDADREWSGLASWQFRPRVAAIEAALEAEYQKPSDTKEAVRLAHEYDADLITEKYWKPTLEEIEKGLQQ